MVAVTTRLYTMRHGRAVKACLLFERHDSLMQLMIRILEVGDFVGIGDAHVLGRRGLSWRSVLERYRYAYLHDRLTPQTLVVRSEVNPAAWFQR